MLYDNYEVKLLQQELSKKLATIESLPEKETDEIRQATDHLAGLVQPLFDRKDYQFEDIEQLEKLRNMLLDLMERVADLKSVLQHKLTLETFSLYEIVKQEAAAGDAEAKVYLKELLPKIKKMRLQSFSEN